MGSVRLRFASVFGVSVLITIAACKDDPSRPPVGGDPGSNPISSSGGGSGGLDGSAEGGLDGGASSSSSGSSGNDAGSCSDLPDMGNYVDQNAIAGDPLNGTGGTIPDGVTYNMSEATKYVGISGTAGPTGTQLRGQLKFQAGVFERVYTTVLTGGNPSETRLRGTYVVNGTQLITHTTCPFAIDDTFQYSVDTNNNTFILTSLLSKESWTFLAQ
jgi:hypothetical protein